MRNASKDRISINSSRITYASPGMISTALILLHITVLCRAYSIIHPKFIRNVVSVLRPTRVYMEKDPVQILAEMEKEEEPPGPILKSKVYKEVKDFFEISGKAPLSHYLHEVGQNYLSLGVEPPHQKQEAWRFTKVRQLFGKRHQRSAAQHQKAVEIISQKIKIEDVIEKEFEQSIVVFVDGIFNPELSNLAAVKDDIELKRLIDCTDDEKKTYFTTILEQDEHQRNSYGSHQITALNLALLQDGMLFRVSDNKNISTPIKILSIATDSESEQDLQSTFNRFYISVGKNASLAVKHVYKSIKIDDSQEKSSLTLPSEEKENPVDEEDSLEVTKAKKKKPPSPFLCVNTFLHVGECSKVWHTSYQDLAKNARVCEVISADVERAANFTSVSVQLGARIHRQNLYVNLLGEKATSNIGGLQISCGGQSHDVHSGVTHFSGTTFSDQQHRIILGEDGEALFKGRIRMPPEAMQSVADQLCRGLMQGKRVRLHAMPTLEVIADDVSCTHGAAISDLDENSMFYLASRGLNRKTARNLLMKNFALESVGDALTEKESNAVMEAINYVVNTTEDDTPNIGQSLLTL